MDDPQEEHELVVKALLSGLSNCVNWKQSVVRQAYGTTELKGYTLAAIKRELVSYVARFGKDVVAQIPESREEYREQFNFYYKTILPLDEFRPHGLFVEMVLTGDDPDCPIVTLVSVHPQQN